MRAHTLMSVRITFNDKLGINERFGLALDRPQNSSAILFLGNSGRRKERAVTRAAIPTARKRGKSRSSKIPASEPPATPRSSEVENARESRDDVKIYLTCGHACAKRRTAGYVTLF